MINTAVKAGRAIAHKMTSFAAPQEHIITGRYCRLEPITEAHISRIFDITTGQDKKLEFTLYEAPKQVDEVRNWLKTKRAAGELPFAIIDESTGSCEGRMNLMSVVPAHGTIEIGHIFFGDKLVRTRAATEAFYLLSSYCMKTLGYRRLEWTCNALNINSRNAAARFGFTHEGTLRHNLIAKGLDRDTMIFSILKDEWPQIAEGFEQWLNPDNFDDKGVQKSKLQTKKLDKN
eukprot:TRINITY_DN7311_c0_g1_i1.p1 TRINITY_DN7311_c0_g1~~TRINITY_DN7311_c0_g1_i1.p1  ORF type:complete len:232 (-),score=57.05 TRINITY_DN7311_c0_g1_i1:15-710(-)